MRGVYTPLVVLLASLVIASFAAADGMSAGAPRRTSLNGAEEAPGPGDGDGTGFAVIRLNVGRARVCWELSWANIVTATASHIHRAPFGVQGPVVVPLFVSGTPTSPASGCTENVNPLLIQEIIDFPERFYVNIHNAGFPAGAIRGQLSVPGEAD